MSVNNGVLYYRLSTNPPAILPAGHLIGYVGYETPLCEYIFLCSSLFYSRQFPVGRIATEQVIDERQALLCSNNLHRYYVRMVVPVDRRKLR